MGADSGSSSDQSESELTRKPKAWVRVLVLCAVLLTAWQVFASFLWIAPYSANAREIVPAKLLSGYMLPLFGQSWSVFAPAPINGDYHFNVRAVVMKDGVETETGWVSATDVELSMIRYNLTPPRAGIQSSEVASNYKEAFDGMGQLQKTVIESEFLVADWEVGLRAALEKTAADDAEHETTPEEVEKKVAKLIKEEHRSTAYATQVAKAIWGDAVQRVQFRVSRQNVVPFAQRHNPAAERPEPMIVLPGWRGLVVEPGQDEENFAKVFREQFERIAQ